MEKITRFIGYEYIDVSVKRKFETLYIDSFFNFGWILEESYCEKTSNDKQTLRFKRDRTLRSNNDLNKLQRQFESLIIEIDQLEFRKILFPSIVAYLVGVVGTIFMACSVFAIVYSSNIFIAVVLAVPGLIGWVIPYLVYRIIHKTKENELIPIIENKYEELYNITKEAKLVLESAL